MTQPRLKLKARVSECTFSSLQMDFNFFFFSNPIIIPKMVGAHSCAFKDIRFPIAKELMINNMSLTFSQYFTTNFKWQVVTDCYCLIKKVI